jgi:anti-sigma regulatory factor (Ser/Thr protein kinase)
MNVSLQEEDTQELELRLTLRNDLAELARVNERATELLVRRGLPGSTVYATQLALEEVLSNVIRYGYADDRRHEIAVSMRVNARDVQIQIVDDGRAFNPLDAPEAVLDVSLAERRVGGLGIHLLRRFVRELRYERLGDRNSLWLRI